MGDLRRQIENDLIWILFLFVIASKLIVVLVFLALDLTSRLDRGISFPRGSLLPLLAADEGSLLCAFDILGWGVSVPVTSSGRRLLALESAPET